MTSDHISIYHENCTSPNPPSPELDDSPEEQAGLPYFIELSETSRSDGNEVVTVMECAKCQVRIRVVESA